MRFLFVIPLQCLTRCRSSHQTPNTHEFSLLNVLLFSWSNSCRLTSSTTRVANPLEPSHTHIFLQTAHLYIMFLLTIRKLAKTMNQSQWDPKRHALGIYINTFKKKKNEGKERKKIRELQRPHKMWENGGEEICTEREREAVGWSNVVSIFKVPPSFMVSCNVSV